MPLVSDLIVLSLDSVRGKRITQHKKAGLSRNPGLIALTGFIAVMSFALSAYGQLQQDTMAAMKNMGGMDSGEQEVAHPFFTHMGMPEGVGVYSLRLGGLLTNTDGKTDPDFAFHFETGLTKFVGVHLRNNAVLNDPHTELMFQFAAVRSEDGWF